MKFLFKKHFNYKRDTTIFVALMWSAFALMFYFNWDLEIFTAISIGVLGTSLYFVALLYLDSGEIKEKDCG